MCVGAPVASAGIRKNMATAAHSQFAAAFKQLETRVDEHIVLHFSYVDELCNCEHGVLDLSRSLLLGK